MSTGGPSDRHQTFATGAPGVESGGPKHTRPIATGGKSSEPPNLARYSSSPVYDLATVVQLVGVRSTVLWGWEQHLGIPAPTRVNEEAGTVVRRYSERDLVAAIWLREQILNGASPPEAVARLRAAARPANGEGESWEATDAGHLPGGRVNTGPLPDSFGPQRPVNTTRPLSENAHAQPYGLGAAEQVGPSRGSYSGALGGTSGIHAATSGGYGAPPSQSQVWVSPLSGPLGNRRVSGALGESVVSGPLAQPVMPGPRSGYLTPGPTFGPVMSGPLPSPQVVPNMAQSADNIMSRSGPWGAAPAGAITTSTSTHGRELRNLMPQLMRAFASFDTLGANHIIQEALSTRSVEMVCTTLLQPALTRVNDLWANHQATILEERFATYYMRGLLYALFQQTPERVESPLVFVGCGPKEYNDVHALVLSVFLRRAGLRVAYLGQDVPGPELAEEVRKRRPGMVALSITSSQRIRALARAGKLIGQLDHPRPTFVFSGPIFVRNPELQKKVASHGLYLGDAMDTATYHAMKLLGMEAFMRR